MIWGKREARIICEDGATLHLTVSHVVSIKHGGDLIRLPLSAAVELADDLRVCIDELLAENRASDAGGRA